jgi:hypothetical protein
MTDRSAIRVYSDKHDPDVRRVFRDEDLLGRLRRVRRSRPAARAAYRWFADPSALLLRGTDRTALELEDVLAPLGPFDRRSDAIRALVDHMLRHRTNRVTVPVREDEEAVR